MKLTWADIEKHRAAATPAQWRRMEAILRDGKPIGQVAKEEGDLLGKVAKCRTTVISSIAHGCMAVLNSMMERPVRVVPPHVASESTRTVSNDVEPQATPTEQSTNEGEIPHQAESPPLKKRKKNNNRGWILAKRPKRADEPESESASIPASEDARQHSAADPSPEQRSRVSAEPDGALALAFREALRAGSKNHSDLTDSG